VNQTEPSPLPQIESDLAEMQVLYDELNEEIAVAGKSPDLFDENAEKQTLHTYVKLRNRYEHELETLEKQYAKMLKHAKAKIERLDFLQRSVAESIAAKLLANGKKKSLTTPFGTCGFRTQPAGIDVFDEQYVLGLIDQGKLPADIKRVKVEVSKSKLNEYVKSTGDLPDGVIVTPERQKFYVK